jgi:hypothetical protein
MKLYDCVEKSLGGVGSFVGGFRRNEVSSLAELVENYQNHVPIPFSRGCEWTCEIHTDGVPSLRRDGKRLKKSGWS